MLSLIQYIVALAHKFHRESGPLIWFENTLGKQAQKAPLRRGHNGGIGMGDGLLK